MIGQTLGHYRIEAKLGEGGMGVVYRAVDTHLGRAVAIKVLPQAFARDPERLARFEREAQVLASLNHPNIAAIYGLEQAGDVRYLVLEYVPGSTLAGPLPVEEALSVGRQIAEAFEAAHEKGIMHRDLKPANVKVTPEGKVKVLDFGLAKAFAGELPAADASQSPTLSVAPTRAGVILGTAAYMSPEQARGRALDNRTDIWSFGCVLYELLSGKQTFGGETVSDNITAILGREPDWSALPVATPQRIRELLGRSLRKDPSRRLQHIGDARIEIDEALAAPASDSTGVVAAARDRSSRQAFLWGLPVVASLITGLVVWLLKPTPPRPAAPATRTVVALPPTDQLTFGSQPSVILSQDGKRLVYAASRGGRSQLYFRRMDRFEVTPIAGTEEASGPFFSPDGELIGFFAGGKLKKVSLSGGAPATLCDAPDGRGASWGSDDTIVFTARSSPGAGLSRVSAAGGAPEGLTTPDASKGEMGHRWPEFLPGGKAILFTTWASGNFDDARIGVLLPSTGQRRVLLEGGTCARYVPASPDSIGTGHLVYGRAGVLLAAPFDPARLEITGRPFPLVQGLQMSTNFTGSAHFSFSHSGTLIYVPGAAQTGGLILMWVDRKGTAAPLRQTHQSYLFPRLSPDGRRVGVQVLEGNHDVWVHELARDTLTRLTFDASFEGNPTWTPDGKRLAFASTRSGPSNLYWKVADGSGGEERLTTSPNLQTPCSFSPDGKWLAFTEIHTGSVRDIWVLPMDGDRKPRPFLQTPFDEREPRFSPDGRFLAYASTESGPSQVYVQPFPGPGGKWQISIEGGGEPVWGRNGRQLYYRHSDRMMAVDVTTTASFSAGKPRPLFEGRYMAIPAFTSYDVAPDGQRFLMVKETEPQEAPKQINVVMNWMEELISKPGGGRR